MALGRLFPVVSVVSSSGFSFQRLCIAAPAALVLPSVVAAAFNFLKGIRDRNFFVWMRCNSFAQIGCMSRGAI